MKKLLPLLFVLAAVGCGSGAAVSAPGAPGGEDTPVLALRVTTDVGEARHKEESLLTDVESEWSATFVRPRVAIDYRRPDGLEVTAELLAFMTPKNEETWKDGGVVVGENDLQLEGYEGRALAGWGVWIEEVGRFSILLGGSMRSVELEREVGGAVADSEFDLPIAEVEARVSLPIRSAESELTGSFDLSIVGGWVVEPEAEVPGAGDIEGDDGYLFRTRVGFTINPHPQLSFFLGGFYERLELEGGVEGAAEWPDSTTNVAGAEVGAIWRY